MIPRLWSVHGREASAGGTDASEPWRRRCASSTSAYVCVPAWIRGVRAWPVDRLLGTRDVRARNCVPVLKLFISPTATDPRRTIAPHTGPTQPGPSGMIMHRSASHYTYTYPVYPVPILPTRYVDYTTSRAPVRLSLSSSMYTPFSPLANPPSDCFCPPIVLHTHAYNTRELHLPISCRPVCAMHDAACKSLGANANLPRIRARRENIKDYRELRENRGKLDFQVTCDGKSEMCDWLIVRRDPDARRLEGFIFLEGRTEIVTLKSTTTYMQQFIKIPKEISSCRFQLNLIIFFSLSICNNGMNM